MTLKGKACVAILVGRSTSSHEDICNKKKTLQELNIFVICQAAIFKFVASTRNP